MITDGVGLISCVMARSPPHSQKPRSDHVGTLCDPWSCHPSVKKRTENVLHDVWMHM